MLEEVGRVLLTMLGSHAQFVMKEEPFDAKVAHDRGESVAIFVGVSDVFAMAYGVVHGGKIDVLGKVFWPLSSNDMGYGIWDMGFEKFEDV